MIQVNFISNIYSVHYFSRVGGSYKGLSRKLERKRGRGISCISVQARRGGDERHLGEGKNSFNLKPLMIYNKARQVWSSREIAYISINSVKNMQKTIQRAQPINTNQVNILLNSAGAYQPRIITSGPLCVLPLSQFSSGQTKIHLMYYLLKTVIDLSTVAKYISS